MVALVPCPNCGKPLQLLPKNYPLHDVQCTACYFRAQVKTSSSRPRNVVFGAGWDIMGKVLKAGYAVPPTIVHFRWRAQGRIRREIRFYPFIPRRTLIKYRLSKRAKRGPYRMFNYGKLQTLPYFALHRDLA